MRKIPYHTLVLYLVLKRISKHRIGLDSFIYFVFLCLHLKLFVVHVFALTTEGGGGLLISAPFEEGGLFEVYGILGFHVTS